MDPGEPARSPYQLSKAENERIFREEIVPELLSAPVPQLHPVAVVLIGQPGAGKTRLGAQLGAALAAHGGFVEVDSDLYKPYHPAYDELMGIGGGRTMAEHTRADGRAWMIQVQEHVRAQRLNALIHETVQNPPYLAETLTAYRGAGHRVEVAVLAVPEALSRQGIVHRYYEQVRDRGAGRLTMPAAAAASYAGILAGADLIDAGRLAEVVSVYRRGEAGPRYRNHLLPDPRQLGSSRNPAGARWARPPGTRASIEAERARPLTAAEVHEFHFTHEMLRLNLGPDWAAELAAIADLTRPLSAAPSRGSGAVASQTQDPPTRTVRRAPPPARPVEPDLMSPRPARRDPPQPEPPAPDPPRGLRL